ncbi:hypothetical protein HPB00_10615 [Streptococcus suis]|nr:hypothetical protein [Streptococcus suis]
MKRITANQYQTSERYYKLPKILFESERYKDMKLEVKVAYAVLKDRLELSLSKGWIDEDGAIYLIYSNSNLMALLGCSKSKLLSIKKTNLTTYGVAYRCTKACDVNREILLSLFAKTTDCFELLSPRFLRFKRQYSISLNEMIQLVLQKPDQNLRLPLIVCQNHVYPAIGLDEVRTFLPRQVKEELFQASLMKQVTG